MTPLRLLQISDVHFGAPLSGGSLGLLPDLVRLRTRERRAAFTRAFELVDERNLDGVLLPGDLFDGESIDVDTLRFVAHTCGEIAPRPVFLAPGNHDPYGGASPYRTRDGEDARGVKWPDNVHLFAHGDFRSARWPGRDDVVVTGCGVAADLASADRRLRERIERPESACPIFLFHGSRDDGSFLQSHKSTYPFSRDELMAQGFRWTALGHYHGCDVIYDDHSRARAAYAGCPFAGGLDETGEKGVLVVEIEEHETRVEFVRIDERRIFDLQCDLGGAGFAEQAIVRIHGVLDEAAVGPLDLVRLRLTGRRVRGLDLAALDSIEQRCAHLRLDTSRLRADVDVERYPVLEHAQTTEARFVATLRDGHVDAGSDELVHRALLYGLDALEHGRIDTRYEE